MEFKVLRVGLVENGSCVPTADRARRRNGNSVGAMEAAAAGQGRDEAVIVRFLDPIQ